MERGPANAVAAICDEEPWRHCGKLGRSTERPKSTLRHAVVLRSRTSSAACAQSHRASHERMAAKGPGQRSAVKAASRRSRSREARALTAFRWSGSGLSCDHGGHPCRACATRRYATNDGARNVDFECFLGSNGTMPLHTVPLQCHPKQCADKHLRHPTARSDTVAFI